MTEKSGTRGLERSATSDLWRRTLSQIPSIFGRLVYLAGLRNVNTGKYEHHGLALVFGEDEANRALKKSHAHTFQEWLAFNIEQQKADLSLYLSSLATDRRTILENWAQETPYRNLVPGSIRAAEKRLYLADLTAILELMKNEHGVSVPDPDA